MPKIKLGNPPATFPHTVKFHLLDGSADEIKVLFQYRTREEFAAFIAGMYPEVKEFPAAPVTGLDVVGGANKALDRDVAYILGCVKGWDLTDDFSEANVRRLVNEYPAAASEIVSGYREAITEGRAKN